MYTYTPNRYTSNISSNPNINRIINEFMNTDIQTPYNFEINSNFGPIGTGFISTFINSNINTSVEPTGIPLSNINVITNVSRFCDIVNNNDVDFID
jgi:hypothetical protein